jgi:hypothetical protein
MGKSYDVWSIKMKNFLWSQDCCKVVVNGFQELDPTYLQAMTNAQRNSFI